MLRIHLFYYPVTTVLYYCNALDSSGFIYYLLKAICITYFALSYISAMKIETWTIIASFKHDTGCLIE